MSNASIDQRPEGQDQDLKRKVMVGAVWTVATRWGVRLLGLLSTVVLARLLEPEDFGLVAMASVFTGIVMAFTEMEMDIPLITARDIDDSYFNTAWTLSVIAGLMAGLVIMLLAPLAAAYYKEPTVAEILILVALTPMILAFSNPKLALLRKYFKFGQEFRISVLTKAITVAISVSLAFWLRDYRALVYGLIAGSLTKIAIEYLFIPYRPRFSLQRRTELLSFSVWLLVRNVAAAAFARVEQLILGAAFGAVRTSYYYMGSELGRMISGEIGLPLGRALLPGMSAAQDDEERMKRGVFMATAGIVVVLPFGFGLAALAPEFIAVVLGEKWLPAAGVLELLSISSSIGVLGAAFGPVLMVRGEVKRLALATVAGALAMLGLAIYLVRYDSLELVAMARALVQCVLLAYFVYLGMSLWKKDIPPLLGIMLRPFLAAVTMYASIKSAQLYLSFDPLVALLLWTIVGVLIFVAVLSTLWWLLGRPQGLETHLLRIAQQVFNRLSNRIGTTRG